MLFTLQAHMSRRWLYGPHHGKIVTCHLEIYKVTWSGKFSYFFHLCITITYDSYTIQTSIDSCKSIEHGTNYAFGIVHVGFRGDNPTPKFTLNLGLLGMKLNDRCVCENRQWPKTCLYISKTIDFHTKGVFQIIIYPH